MAADPLEILVNAFAEALIDHGHAPLPAYLEAEDRTERVMEALLKQRAPVGHLLRRVKVYQLKSEGLEPCAIGERLGMCRTLVHDAYAIELERRRRVAA